MQEEEPNQLTSGTKGLWAESSGDGDWRTGLTCLRSRAVTQPWIRRERGEKRASEARAGEEQCYREMPGG